MKIKLLECPVVGCRSDEIEQITEYTLLGFPRGMIDKNELRIHGHCKKCGAYFTFSGTYDSDETVENIIKIK